MKCNVGNTDRIIRIVIGLVVGILGIIFQSWWGLIGLVFIATGFMKFCLLYIPFKINTSKK